MIALRSRLERASRHPLLGPFVLVFLMLLIAFTVIHGTHDQMHEDALICVALVLMALVSLLVPRPHMVMLPTLLRARGPPRRPRQSLQRSALLFASRPRRL